MSRRIQVFKGILWFIVGLAAAVTTIRFARGLGTTTAPSDITPWGLWIGFDVMGGIALATGGFVIAAIVHIFRREKYRAVARPAVLMAMLGYGAAAVGLLYDLGLPRNLWQPAIYRNPHSSLFEVAWCVMLYLAVLILVLLPVVIERSRFHGIHRFLLRMQIPLIVLGILLATLHQSSLGALLSSMPFRLHPLWYTSLLPGLLFVSAICLGMAMLIFASTITAWLYERQPQTEMLAGLGRLAAFGLAFYLAFRFIDLARLGKLPLILTANAASALFLFEIGLCTVVPLILFAIPAVRRNQHGIFVASSVCVIGFVINRIDTSGLAQVWAAGSDDFPAWTEIAISLGIVSGFALIFFFVQEHFPVDSEIRGDRQSWGEMQLFRLPRFDRRSRIGMGDTGFAARRAYSLLFVVALGLGLVLTPWSPLVEATPAQHARDRDSLRRGHWVGRVSFPHDMHIELMGPEACGTCHHLNKPGERGTPCSECHRDMYLPTRIFDHPFHAEALGGRESCAECHAAGLPKVAATARVCSACHEADMMAVVEGPLSEFDSPEAPPLRKAMHQVCLECHRGESVAPAAGKQDLFRCATCHRTPITHRQEIREAAGREGGDASGPATSRSGVRAGPQPSGRIGVDGR